MATKAHHIRILYVMPHCQDPESKKQTDCSVQQEIDSEHSKKSSEALKEIKSLLNN